MALPEAPFPVAWLVPDTNVVLHQLDLLERRGCPGLDHIVILETVVEEVRHNNLGAYRRLHKLLAAEGRSVVFFANEVGRFVLAAEGRPRSIPTYTLRADACCFTLLGHSLPLRLLPTLASPPQPPPLSLSFATFSPISAAVVQHSRHTYVRRTAGESPNDRNDRAIRVAAAWFTAQLAGFGGGGGGPAVALVTDDRLNRRACAAMGAGAPRALTSRGLVRGLEGAFPDLPDLLASFDDDGENAKPGGGGGASTAGRDGGSDSEGSGDEGGAKSASKGGAAAAPGRRGGRGAGGAPPAALYPAHMSAAEVEAGVLAGRLFQGTLRCSRTRSVTASCWNFLQRDGDGRAREA